MSLYSDGKRLLFILLSIATKPAITGDVEDMERYGGFPLANPL